MKRILIVMVLFLPISGYGKLGGQPLVDSLVAALTKAEEDTNKVKLLKKLAALNEYTNPEEGFKYAQQSLDLAEELKWQKGIARGADILGAFYLNRSDFPKALEFYFRALKINEEMNDKDAICRTVGNIGTVYIAQSNYEKAQEYFAKALKMSEELHDLDGIAANMSNMGNVYFHQKKYDQALEYDLKALKSYEEQGNKAGVVAAMSNVGSIYHIQNKNREALEYFFKGLKISEEIDNKNYIAASLGNIGNTYMYIAIDSTSGARPDRAANLQKAIEYLSKGIKACKEIGFLDPVVGFNMAIADAYAYSGRYKEALEYYKEYTTLKDSVFSTDNKVRIADLGTQREADLKNKQVEINRIQENKKRNERGFFIVGLGLLLMLIIVVMRNFNIQKMVNKRLEEEQTKSLSLMRNLQESIQQKDDMATQLSVSADMKSKFLANISHELRTPVTLLTGMLELMKDKKAAENGIAADKGKLDVAYNNSRKLQYMVEEILDLSRLEINEAKVNIEAKEMAPLLKRMVYAFETFIEKEQLVLEFNADKANGIYVLVDENKLEKIVNNLVYNAIKFNRKGGWIKVNVHIPADRKHLNFSVSNSGNGIKPEDLPHIFERFYQGKSSTTKAEGVGIGLSLVKEFTVLLGGTVDVSSSRGEGTTFTLQFPVAEKQVIENTSDPEIVPLTVAAWENFPEQQSVLLVEDNEEMRYYLREVLGDKVNLAEAANGKEALKWLEHNEPDLIISDMMMPEMDGPEFIANLKNSEQFRKIPVITLTALADTESQLRMLRMGVDDYIVKPFNAAELRIRVYNILNNQEERKQFSKLPAEPDDIPVDSAAAEEFRNKITAFVLARMKNSNVSVYDLAYELALSERQLYRLAKSLTGCTPAQLIKEVRLQKAYELLVSGQINKVEDVSKRVGFENPGYFSRQFLERFGKRPTEFI